MEHDFATGVVESHLLRALGRMAVATGVEGIEIACVRSRATEPVRRFLERRGATKHEYEYGIALAAALGPINADCGCGTCSGANHDSLSPAGVLQAMRSASSAPVATPLPFRLPTTDAERWVSGVWREVLGVERVGAHDDFFALGGDSLAASRAMARLRAAFGVDLPVTALFEEPTLAAQAARLVSARIEASDPSLVDALLEEERMAEVAND
jgi:hypothetical protein